MRSRRQQSTKIGPAERTALQPHPRHFVCGFPTAGIYQVSSPGSPATEATGGMTSGVLRRPVLHALLRECPQGTAQHPQGPRLTVLRQAKHPP